jgi:hypothetical protein
MPNPNDMGENFVTNLLTKIPALEPHRENIERWAKWATHFLAKIDQEESKKAKLCQIVYFNAVNRHVYGDPAHNDDLRTLLEDLGNCFSRPIMDAYTQEQLSETLDKAFKATPPNRKAQSV